MITNTWTATHTFRLDQGQLVLPPARSLAQAHQNRDQIMLAGLARQVEDVLLDVQSLTKHDQTRLDLDPRPNHIVYSGATESSGLSDRGPQPQGSCIDAEIELDERGYYRSIKAFGPSRMGRVDLEPHLLTDWTLSYTYRGNLRTTTYVEGHNRVELVHDTARGTLTVTAQGEAR